MRIKFAFFSGAEGETEKKAKVECSTVSAWTACYWVRNTGKRAKKQTVIDFNKND